MKRTDLVSNLALVSNALAKESEQILPILKGLRFKDGNVMAHDDIVAVELPLDFPVTGIVPGHQLIKFLESCDAKEVTVESDKKSMTVKCGRARLKQPITSVKDWPFAVPKDYEGKELQGIKVGEGFFKALTTTAAPVRDRGLASWLGGVNFYFRGKALHLYGVNPARTAVCYVAVKVSSRAEKLSGRYIAPANFCKAALAMAKVFGEDARLYVTPDFMILLWSEKKAVCFTKLIDPDGPNVENVIGGAMEAAKTYVKITASMVQSLKRAASLGVEGACKIKITDDKLIFKTDTDGNSLMNDSVKLSYKHPNVEATITADALMRMIDHCAEIAFLENQVVARSDDGGFYYVVANKAEKGEE